MNQPTHDEVFEAERGRLHGLAYRMLGSAADADDVVQETWLRWHRLGDAGRAAVDRPAAWLTTAASRIALDVLKSARRQREHYVGPWLPEPLLTAADPADGESQFRQCRSCHSVDAGVNGTGPSLHGVVDRDIASIDGDGYVSIIGRKKEIIITAGGKNITPVNIEQEVKRHPLVSQCVVIGDRRPYLIALITLDQEALTRFAAEQGMLDEPSAMINSPLVREELEKQIEEVNKNFARVEQIKRFHILPNDLSQEGGELTPTLKIKRPVIATKYEKEIDELYAS